MEYYISYSDYQNFHKFNPIIKGTITSSCWDEHPVNYLLKEIIDNREVKLSDILQYI
jgi:hypothetical protein